MKKILVLLICLLCMGCPPGQFYDYMFIGQKLLTDDLSYTRIAYNADTDLHIRVGYYHEFINDKEQGLATVIKYDPNFDLKDHRIVKSVTSSFFGQLRSFDSLPYTVRAKRLKNVLFYKLPVQDKDYRKAFKKGIKDTITIVLENERTLYFIRE